MMFVVSADAQRRRYEQALSLITLSSIANAGKVGEIKNSEQYLLSAKAILDELVDQDRKQEVWKLMGECQLRLRNYPEAANWLRRVVHSTKLKEEKMTDVTILYGVCLNKQKRHKLAAHYLLVSLKMEMNTEAVFYLSHSLFVLRRMKQFNKYAATLAIHDLRSEYLGYLTDFLLANNPTNHLVEELSI